MTPEDINIFRETIRTSLRAGKCKIVFTKTDGTKRTLIGTLCPTLIPPPEPVDPDKPVKVRKENPDVQAVYDLENNGWRSFRWDSLSLVEHI